MARYKVPQDVEADDKLLGPFSFRQFVYLLIAGGLIALAVGLFQLFPFLAIIPVPFILFFAALALPLKKDQPMETYLAAIISYYIKPRNRIWTPGQRESTIQITAPKIVEETRTRDITGEEVTHRLSFLADIVDTEGYAIKGVMDSPMRDDLAAEASTATDIFETNHFADLGDTIKKDENKRREEVMEEMRESINEAGNLKEIENRKTERPEEKRIEEPKDEMLDKEEILDSPTVVLPGSPVEEKVVEKTNRVEQDKSKKDDNVLKKSSIIELAENKDFSVSTIAKEAKRLKGKEEGEVFISLH